MTHENTNPEDHKITEAIDGLSEAVRAVAHGGTDQPTGLEALAMAIAGEGRRTPISEAVTNAGDEIASAVRELAEAVRALAGARSD